VRVPDDACQIRNEVAGVIPIGTLPTIGLPPAAFVYPGWELLLPLLLVILGQQLWIFLSARRSAHREELFRIITENAADMIALVSVKGRRLYNSPAYQKALGYSAAELARTSVFEQIHPDDRAKVLEAARQARETGVGRPLQYRIRHQDGSWRVLESTASPIRNAKGNVEKLVIVNRDVTARKQVEERLVHDALHDVLTGLPNRRMFLELLQRCFLQAQRDRNFRYAVLCLDVDDFSECYAAQGAALADQALIEIARRLDTSLRDGDTVSRPAAPTTVGDLLLSRVAGDEFTVLLEGIRDPSDAMRVATRLQAAVAEPFHVEGIAPRSATLSMGIALSDPSVPRAGDLLGDAETALRRAQAMGGNRCELFDTAMHSRAVGRLQLENELRTALNHRQLRVFYQPMVHLETRQIVGFEALVRWQHPTQGLISPAKFMEAAEDTGLIASIDQWVILEACRQTCRWQSQYPTLDLLRIAANISARHFASPQLSDEIRAVLRETQIESSALQLEISDRIATADPSLTAATLAQLKRLNVTTAMDDYGTGATSLGDLRVFPLDVLKIDRALVTNMLADRASRDVIELILLVGHNWQLQITAQGIEKSAHCEALKALGCLVGQGYWFAPPLAAEAAGQLLRQRTAPSLVR
jgi:PAS domain S-box-containing protein/diguanylate cyclase (GGDEF)-like protein